MEKAFFTDQELANIEERYADGLTLAQLIDVFSKSHIHLSEATFRKYVQLGLLVRSKRVGRKGKHQGSLGMYPISTVRQLNTIRQMMAAKYTIEDIQRSFLRFKNNLSSFKKMFSDLLGSFSEEIKQAHFDKNRKKELTKELQSIEQLGSDLATRLERMEQQLVSPLQRSARERAFASGVGMGANELLQTIQ